MTAIERQDILASELLSIDDISRLWALSKFEASRKMNEWKRKLVLGGQALRIEMRGKIHRQDYFDATGTKPDPVVIQIING